MQNVSADIEIVKDLLNEKRSHFKPYCHNATFENLTYRAVTQLCAW